MSPDDSAATGSKKKALHGKANTPPAGSKPLRGATLKLLKLIHRYLGVIVLAGALLYAAVRVMYNQLTYEAPDVTTIRLCHWQLEAGFRNAFDALITEYEQHYRKTHGRKIRVVQMPISERGYRQFVNTGLIGEMAPDIIEKGMAKTASDPAYVARFFLPLGDFLAEPNPYNRGTPLEGVSWRNTFFDGLQSAYDRELLDYYYIPFSMFTTRIYFNRNLYRESTGRTAPPGSFLDFLDVCKQIRQYAGEQDKTLVPLAGSKYQGRRFASNYINPFLYDLIRRFDRNFDGDADTFETYQAYVSGLWSFHDPRLLAAWQCMVDIAGNFQRGWLSAQRDDAVFMFVQERAVMIASGSWDASSIIEQAGDRFEVGIFDFPMPSDHPVYRKYVRAPPTEANIRASLPWGINRKTRHPELCIDFLRFCTTRSRNERFNPQLTWLPVVRGAQLSEELEPFRPRVEGFGGDFKFKISTNVNMTWGGDRYALYGGKITPEEFAGRLTDAYEKTANEGYRLQLAKMRRNVRNLERILASILCRQHFDENRTSEPVRISHKAMQLIHSTQEFGHQHSVNKAAARPLHNDNR